MTHTLVLFFATFSAAFVATVPPGLLNMNAAKTSAEKGKKNGFSFSFGVAVMVSIQAYIAVLVSKYLHHNTYIIDILLKIAVVVFLVLALYFFRIARRNKNKAIPIKRQSKKNCFLRGMLLAMLNFLTIPYYAALNISWKASGWIQYAWTDTLIFILGGAFGTFTVLSIYVIYFNALEAKTHNFSKYSNYILSILMLILTIITCIRLLYNMSLL